MNRRAGDVAQFYALLDRLATDSGGPRRLGECNGRMRWPQHGIYFFFEPGEHRGDGTDRPRVVRVGTHALKAQSKSSLWQRLSQHRGNAGDGGGNHRGSIFRLLVGIALARCGEAALPASWGVGGDPGQAARRLGVERAAVKQDEAALEARVSACIRAMPFLWLGVDDPPGPDSDRGLIERNAIALLSGFVSTPVDPATRSWLGRHSDRERVWRSGLWNNNHVDESHHPAFLTAMARWIGASAA